MFSALALALKARSFALRVKSLLTSRLDYDNALLYGTTTTNLNKLQVAQNTLARVVCQAPRSVSAMELRRLALVANPPANNIQDGGHYIQDQNYRHSCLPLSPDPGLPTRKDTTVCWQTVTLCQLKLSASALPQSGTHCHITVVPLNCSVLSSVT